MTDVTITETEYRVLRELCELAHQFVHGSEADAYILLKRNKEVAAKIAALQPDTVVRFNSQRNRTYNLTTADAHYAVGNNLTAYRWLWFEDSKTLCRFDLPEE